MNWKNILISILSVVITLLGGSQYQQFNSLNEIKSSLDNIKSSYNCDIAKFESDWTNQSREFELYSEQPREIYKSDFPNPIY